MSGAWSSQGAKRVELASVVAELERRELHLSTLKDQISQFEARYLREVGSLYAELDDWNAKIAELRAGREQTPEARAAARAAREQAQATAQAASALAPEALKGCNSRELKALRREVARALHPDRARNEADRILREQLMKEANAAFSRRDAAAMRRILEEYRDSPESVLANDLASDLERIERQIRRTRRRLQEIEDEISRLTSS